MRNKMQNVQLSANIADGFIQDRSSKTGWYTSRIFNSLAKNRWFLFILFSLYEAIVFVVIPASTRIGQTADLTTIQVLIAAAFLIVTFLLQRSAAGKQYSELFYAYFVAAVAVLVSLLFGGYIHQLLNIDLDSASGIALAKLSQSVLRVFPLLLLVKLAGGNRQSIFLAKGRLAIGLFVGAIAFTIFAVLAYGPWVGDDEIMAKLLSSTPWVLLFIFANAIEEELLFRGLFLKKYEVFFNRHTANLLTAVVFTLVHIQVTYAADILQFLLILFPLGLAFGYLMQKTNSIWGSVVFHAGADLLLIVTAFAAL